MVAGTSERREECEKEGRSWKLYNTTVFDIALRPKFRITLDHNYQWCWTTVSEGFDQSAWAVTASYEAQTHAVSITGPAL